MLSKPIDSTSEMSSSQAITTQPGWYTGLESVSRSANRPPYRLYDSCWNFFVASNNFPSYFYWNFSEDTFNPTYRRSLPTYTYDH